MRSKHFASEGGRWSSQECSLLPTGGFTVVDLMIQLVMLGLITQVGSTVTNFPATALLPAINHHIGSGYQIIVTTEAKIVAFFNQNWRLGKYSDYEHSNNIPSLKYHTLAFHLLVTEINYVWLHLPALRVFLFLKIIFFTDNKFFTEIIILLTEQSIFVCTTNLFIIVAVNSKWQYKPIYLPAMTMTMVQSLNS